VTRLGVIGPKPDPETIGDPLYLGVGRPQQATIQISAGEQMSVDVADASTEDAIFPREVENLFVPSWRWTNQRVQSTKRRRSRAGADAEIKFRQDHGMDLGYPLAEESHEPFHGRVTVGEREPNFRVYADQLRTRRRRGALAGASSNSPASRSATSWRLSARSPSSMTAFREVGAASFRRRRSSRTALVTSSSSALSMSSVVRTAGTITPALRSGRFLDAFRPPLPRTVTERKT
jgi:hypothetical protein